MVKQGGTRMIFLYALGILVVVGLIFGAGVGMALEHPLPVECEKCGEHVTKFCYKCGYEHGRKKQHIASFKQGYAEAQKLTSPPPAMPLPKERITKLIALCHPDKHNGSR